ncbi:hypothetical protein BBROOKSOX_1749 [Bathymodiolus brooksi thiotrophic gill symbiont]|nr:hypothetical protein BBROOKSOX_1749 [Bathymodiolus brooksi thiotrophic gill symbiont]
MFFPSSGSYYKIEHNKGKYLGRACSGTVGAPSLVYFPFHGIYFSLKIGDFSNYISFGIHIPEGKNAQLVNNELTLLDKNNIVLGKLILRPSKHQISYYHGGSFFKSKDPFGTLDYFDQLSGGTTVVKYTFLFPDHESPKWYQFISSIDLDIKQHRNGFIKLPKLRIDNIFYDVPLLEFKKDTYFELAPWNC